MDSFAMKLGDIQKEYYREVRAIAEAVAAECDLLTVDAACACDEANEYVWESVNGSQWVIYTFRAKLVSVVSDNDDAYLDIVSEDEQTTPEVRAFYAMLQDVNDLLYNEWFYKE